tara:strand:+ start:279 stop:401 length:123 start_codon:yes stop_codon:yes gene_type:complete
MKKVLKPAGTALSNKISPEKLGLPSNKQIKSSVYAKCGKK